MKGREGIEKLCGKTTNLKQATAEGGGYGPAAKAGGAEKVERAAVPY